MLKRFLRATALLLVPFLASTFIRLLYLTNKKRFLIERVELNEPTIFACWHGELLMLKYLYEQYRQIPHAKVLISSHFDGQLISKTIAYFGFGTIAGSTNRNAAKVLMQAIKTLRDGYDVGITPDGPKGPRHKVADGLVAMAHKTNAKIVLVRILPTKKWQLNSWDKFEVPKPFGELVYVASKPLDVSKMTLNEANAYIEEMLEKMSYGV